MENHTSLFITPLICTLILCYVIIFLASKNFFGKYGKDKEDKIQKINTKTSYRFGSLPILISVVIFGNLLLEDKSPFILFLLCVLPCYIIGFLEDITSKVSIKLRLTATIVSSFMIVLVAGAVLSEADLAILNFLFSYPYVSILFSVIGLTAIANAWNFIDGINGLSSGLGITSMIALSYFAITSGMYDIFIFLMLVGASTTGFWIINILTGRIFLGDSGAYLLGLVIGWSGIRITEGGSGEVSAWAVFLIIIYPASELIFSFMRRIFLKKSPFEADNLHFHSLCLLNYRNHFSKSGNHFSNSLIGFFLVFIGSFPALYTVYVDGVFNYVIYAVIFCIILYLFLYRKLKKYTNKGLDKNNFIINKE